MKKLILSLVSIFTAIGLQAGETTVEKLHEHYSDESNKTDNPLIKEVAKGLDEKASKPTQRAKNLNEAVERWSNGTASEADKELIKSEDEPFIKEFQNSTVYPFNIDINSPVYHTLAIGYGSIPTTFSAIVDLYMVKHCTDDLSKMTKEDIKNLAASREFFPLIGFKSPSFSISEDTYTKYVLAARLFNCGDSKAYSDYIDSETVDATVLSDLDPQKSAPQIIEFLFENKKRIECHIFGEAYKFDNGKYGIRVKKQKCGTKPEKEIDGVVYPSVENTENRADTTFSTLNSGDKVKIYKLK